MVHGDDRWWMYIDIFIIWIEWLLTSSASLNHQLDRLKNLLRLRQYFQCVFKRKLRCLPLLPLFKHLIQLLWKCLHNFVDSFIIFRSLMSMIRTMTRSWTSWSTGASWRRRWRRSCRRGSTIKRSPRRTRRTWRDSESFSTLINSDYCIIKLYS